jgi:aldose 1-epimerase
MTDVNIFGTLPDGDEVFEIRLGDGTVSASILTYGARLRDLAFDGGDGPKSRVLGFATLAKYLADRSYAGSVVGRYANRIAEGRFVLDGRSFQLTRNEGPTHLHGGASGFSHRNWRIVDRGLQHVTLELRSPANDEGYPGALTVRCTYRLAGSAALQLDFTATTDAPTIINLATHSYFNLDGTADILRHLLQIPAESYLPIDAGIIPTGEIAAVAGTPFDFRRLRPVGSGMHYDHNFVIDRQRVATPRLMARLDGPATGTRLEIHSTEPGLQFYDGAGFPGSRHAGLCLEPQIFPNSPNQPGFPDATLRPGETYRQVTDYRFSRI